MARKGYRPGRNLVVFMLGVAMLYGLVILGGNWKPALGLDLQGGTRISLLAEGSPEGDSLEEARKIIDQRVNGSGVSEASVTTQGSSVIQVEIPGDARRDLIDTVERQAQLRFRLVACGPRGGACDTGMDQAPGVVEPDAGINAPEILPEDETLVPDDSEAPDSEAPSNNRPPVALTDEPIDEPVDAEPVDGEATEDGTAPAEGNETAPEPIAPPEGGDLVDQPLQWMNTPNQAAIDAYNAFQCPTDGSRADVVDDPARPLVTCDELGQKYLLSAAAIEGTELRDASSGIPQNSVSYAVTLSFNGPATKVFAEISRTLYESGEEFAIVLDGQVLSAPRMDGVITNGEAQITGDFTEEEAANLATSLRYGALPISFAEPMVETIGPSLAGNQLQAGMWAGGIGLALVMIYCLVYYRGLGLVVFGSLIVSALIIYATVLLLAKTAGFTLTLPGIAGLIIGVGVTADSFVIFFERIRDEMRDGKSMRVAVETGWKRAKKTRVAANVVSLLSAAVLYLFATGAVKGFGFTLGLSTLIDLAILFWFTKPLVSWLAKFKFFNGGGELSGLSKGTLGMDEAVQGAGA